MKVLPRHSLLRLVSVDQFGFLGREGHPQESDVGRVGMVKSTSVDWMAEDGTVDQVTISAGAEVLEDMSVCYRVVLVGDVGEQDWMAHEVEVLEGGRVAPTDVNRDSDRPLSLK